MIPAADRAHRFLAPRFPGAETEPLHQEASGRIYLRVLGEGRVLMVRPDPFLERTDPYCRATELFQDCGVRVPRILETEGRSGLVLLEDCGDDLLSRVLPDLSPREIASLWGEALEITLRLRGGTRLLHPDRPAGRLRLGPERLEWELRFFHRHWIEGMRECRLTDEEGSVLRGFYRRLADEVWEALPPVLCHRDFHARNLLRHADGGLVVTDHQDARWGPPLYDPASLARDPYVELPEGLEEDLVARWAEASGFGPAAVGGAYERTALQRNLKAAGTYACQVTVHGRGSFRPSLAPTLRHAARALETLPEYDGAREVLERRGLLEDRPPAG